MKHAFEILILYIFIRLRYKLMSLKYFQRRDIVDYFRKSSIRMVNL